MSSGSVLVAAIDFGTTYSGWAFSFKHEFERDPTHINAKHWHGDQLISSKAPTCVLINPDGKTFDSFGYEAESKYANLAVDEKHEKWFFFKRFKMMLFDKVRLSRNVNIEDVLGKPLPAKRVFSMVIKFLKEDLIQECNKQLSGIIVDTDITWVLTVPAIWNDVAKQFMREAAVEAGILGEQLKIALEPEAASIYCRHLPVQKKEDSKSSLASMKSGTSYLVLDAGGGTVDITVHQVVVDNKVKEVHKANGGDWGGTRIDLAYENLLISIVGPGVMETFKREHMDDFIDLFRDFETKKRDIPMDKVTKATIRIPPSLSDLVKSQTGKEMETILQEKFDDKITYTGGKMRMNGKILRDLYNETVDKIIQHTKRLLKEEPCTKCTTILMVGGFSECCILQAAFKTSFPEMNIIVPSGAGLVVLKGAVIYGHLPTSIIERICKYTYGLKVSHRTSLRKCNHPETPKEIRKDRITRCINIFSIHVEKGQSVKLGEEQKSENRYPKYDEQREVRFIAYASKNRQPKLTTDEGCFELGKISIPIEDTSLGRNRKYKISYIFGGTEIVVKVVDTTTDKTYFLSVDCLD